MITWDELLLIIYRFGLLALAIQLAFVLYPDVERAGGALVRLARKIWHA